VPMYYMREAPSIGILDSIVYSRQRSNGDLNYPSACQHIVSNRGREEESRQLDSRIEEFGNRTRKDSVEMFEFCVTSYPFLTTHAISYRTQAMHTQYSCTHYTHSGPAHLTVGLRSRRPFLGPDGPSSEVAALLTSPPPKQPA
jgi:hypothetical protein